MKKLTNILLQFANFFRRIYWRIFKPVTFGVRVILVKDNDLVLVKHRYDKFWYLPGGGVKKDETEKDAAKR
ncbi:MAG: NUDIX domain-containing protein, partial [bacterium]